MIILCASNSCNIACKVRYTALSQDRRTSKCEN
jgi:hypothetical protein